MDQLEVSGQLAALDITQHVFRLYGSINEINLKENVVNIMGPYDPAEHLARIIGKL